MRLDIFFTSLLILIMFIVGGTLIMSEQQDKYDYTIDDNAYGDVDKYTSQIQGNATAMKDDILGPDVSEETSENNMLLGAFKSFPKMFSIIKSSGGLIMATSKIFGVPAELVTLVLLMIMMVAIFAVIYLIFRFQGR